jgi:hypothetical protein
MFKTGKPAFSKLAIETTTHLSEIGLEEKRRFQHWQTRPVKT